VQREVPGVRFRGQEVLSIHVSDLHLSHIPPIARSAEMNWYRTQADYLHQLRAMQDLYSAPIIVAGDIFNSYKEPAELVNYLIDVMPIVHAIPGQHDLPFHRLEDIHKSVYWTLVKAGKIKNLSAVPMRVSDRLWAMGFPYGVKVHPLEGYGQPCVAVIHSYVWIKGKCYPGAPKERRLARWEECLRGYFAAAFGDNHQGFISHIGKTSVINCGTFMRRRIDEIDYKPQVGLLLSSGKFVWTPLQVKYDKFIDNVILTNLLRHHENDPKQIQDLVKELKEAGDSAEDFISFVRRWLERKKIPRDVKNTILLAMEAT